MEKFLYVDGNSLLFRAFYATSNQNLLTSSNIPVNAVYGFINLLNKAIEMFEPTHIICAFDTGKPTFRHQQYDQYKAHRKEVPTELIPQFQIVREFLDSFGIFRIEIDGIEADDIIGSLSKTYQFESLLLTSDRDYLQLIDDHVKVVFMKKGLSDFDIYDQSLLYEKFALKPSQIIDLKGLMGDSSDNIKGVSGIGEKTALKLLSQYDTIENLYLHIDEIKGKTQEKLLLDKESAFFSKELATIDINQKFECNIDHMLFSPKIDSVLKFLIKYEMNSLIAKFQNKYKIDIQPQAKISNFDDSDLNSEAILFVDHDHNSSIINAIIKGIYIINKNKISYLDFKEMSSDKFKQFLESDIAKNCIESKYLYHFCLKNNIIFNNLKNDLNVLAYVIDSRLSSIELIADDNNIVYNKYVLNNPFDFMLKVFDIFDKYLKILVQQKLEFLYYNIDLALVKVLAKMEFVGIDVDIEKLKYFEKDTQATLNVLTKQIYDYAGKKFNINSPKQLSSILFDHLMLPTNKKRSTSVDVLENLVNKHPIIPCLLEYRKLSKFHGTYALGLQKFVSDDNKIHTTFNQTMASTGRLSSSDPNLQNISVRNDLFKSIRKCFIAPKDYYYLSLDYSQIELRILAMLANEKTMLNAFENDLDIHSQTALKLFNLNDISDVSDDLRRIAKTVNFGIIYGLSDFGLSNSLQIPISQARDFINSYESEFSGINNYMKNVVDNCQKHGYVTTLWGRRRYIDNINHNNFLLKQQAIRMAMNAPVQGSASDLIKIAMIKIDKLLQENNFDSFLVLQVHDEVILQVKKSELEDVTKLVVQAMTNISEINVKLDVSCDYGTSWYEV